MRFANLPAKESAKLAVNAVLIFWQQARILTRRENKCVDKLLKLYETQKTIMKHVSTKRSASMRELEESFVDELDNLFDIASPDALQRMQIEETIAFANCRIGSKKISIIQKIQLNSMKKWS